MNEHKLLCFVFLNENDLKNEYNLMRDMIWKSNKISITFGIV